MAAATVAARGRLRVLGDIRFRRVAFTALADTNTHVVEGGPTVNILGVWPLKSSTNAVVTATWSGQTITFSVSTGTPDVTVGILTD